MSTSWSFIRNFASLPHIGQNSSRKYPWEWHTLSMVSVRSRGQPGAALNPFRWLDGERGQVCLSHGLKSAIAEERLQVPEQTLGDRLAVEVHETGACGPSDRALEHGIVRRLEGMRREEVPEGDAAREGHIRDPRHVVSAADPDRDGGPGIRCRPHGAGGGGSPPWGRPRRGAAPVMGPGADGTTSPALPPNPASCQFPIGCTVRLSVPLADRCLDTYATASGITPNAAATPRSIPP